MIKFGTETEPLHFSCPAHAIHLCVCDVLYKSNANTANDFEEDEECEHEDLKDQNEIDILPKLKLLITKARKIVKLFCKSPVKKNDMH